MYRVDSFPGHIWWNFSFPVHPFYLREVRRARFSTCFVRSYAWWCSETWLRSALLRWFYQLSPPSEKIRQSWISMDHTDFSNLQLPFLPTFYILVDISLVFQTFLFGIKIYIYIIIYRDINYYKSRKVKEKLEKNS